MKNKVNMSDIANKINFIYGDECEKNTVGIVIFFDGANYFFDAEYKNKMSNEEVEALLLRGALVYKDGKYVKPSSFNNENISFSDAVVNPEDIEVDLSGYVTKDKLEEYATKEYVDEAILKNNDSDGNTDIQDKSLQYDVNGIDHNSLSKRLDNIEGKMLSDLRLTSHVISTNLINDYPYKNTVYNGDFTITVAPGCILAGNNYILNIYFTDGTKVQTSNAVWKMIYIDDTKSTVTCSVGAWQQATKEVKGILVDFVADADTMYSDKIYDYMTLNQGTTAKEYDEFNIDYDSECINDLYNELDNFITADQIFTESENLFIFSDITENIELQPYNTVNNEIMNATNYIPVTNNECIYVYPGVSGSQVAQLYDINKNRIGWMNLSTTQNVQNVIEKENVAYLRFNIPDMYLRSDFIVSKSPILNKNIPAKIFNDKLLNPHNSNVNRNWWYGKIGDSLGDSLTGQGYFQKYTSGYFNLQSFSNHGVGGSKLSGEDVDESRPSMWKDSRINALRNDADFITILGGQNDGNVEIGEITKENMDTDTYVGALNVIIEKIYTKYNGNITIILCTPFYVPSEGENSIRFKSLGDAVLDVGKLHGIPVADFGGMSGANKYTSNLYWDSSDRTHPKAEFYMDKIAPILIGVMEKIKPIDFNDLNSTI